MHTIAIIMHRFLTLLLARLIDVHWIHGNAAGLTLSQVKIFFFGQYPVTILQYASREMTKSKTDKDK